MKVLKSCHLKKKKQTDRDACKKLTSSVSRTVKMGSKASNSNIFGVKKCKVNSIDQQMALLHSCNFSVSASTVFSYPWH